MPNILNNADTITGISSFSLFFVLFSSENSSVCPTISVGKC